MVRSAACPTVLRPLPNFVVTYSTFSSCGFLNFFVFSYVLPHIFLFSSSILLWVAGYLFL